MDVTLRCAVVDDEAAGRKALEMRIAETPFLALAGSFPGPEKAREWLQHNRADLLFLDIQMPGTNGIDLLRSLPSPPLTILVTAHSHFALQGFELDVVDYLLKPVSASRFAKAAQKALEIHTLKHSGAQASNDYFFVKCSGQYEKVRFDDLLYVEASNNSVILQLRDRRLTTYLTFRSIADRLPEARFMKVHKSFAVALDKITAVDASAIRLGEHTVSLSKSLRSVVLERVVSDRLIRR